MRKAGRGQLYSRPGARCDRACKQSIQEQLSDVLHSLSRVQSESVHPDNQRIRSGVQRQSAAEADTEMECSHEVGYRSDTGKYKECVGGNEVSWAIRFFYRVIPLCIIMQTFAIMWMAWVMTRVAMRRRKRGRRKVSHHNG